MNIAFFPLSWHSCEGEIQIYGWIQEGTQKATCLRIQDFQPYLYVKLPDSISWSQAKCLLVTQKFESFRQFGIDKCKAFKMRGIYSNVLAPKGIYIYVSFTKDSNRSDFKRFVSKPLSIQGLGCISFECYEHNASPILQLICKCKILSADWFTFKRVPLVSHPISKCEKEFIVSWKDLKPMEKPLQMPAPIIMGYDIETYSHDPAVFCDPKHPDDVIFQISLVFARQGSHADTWKKYILSLGQPDIDDKTIIVVCCKTEKDLLSNYTRIVDEENPNLLIGYNTFGFDNRYMLERSKHLMIHDDFVRHGCTFEKAALRETEWTSSAYGVQKIFFLDTKGRVHIDLLVLVSRDFKLDSYKLGSIAQHFLGRTKDPLTHYDIYDFYESGMNADGPSKELGLVARYCVKDSVLVVELFEYLKYWYSLTAMAKICYIPMADLFQRGQQIKVFSQVYKYCYDNGIVVENNSYKMPHENYVIQGAYVLDAIPGLYNNVVSFDFASLYPSIIISHNIDYGTLVQDRDDIKDDDCYIVEWEEHFGCSCEGAEKPKKIKGKTTVVCEKYKFKWLKEPSGVLPAIIKNLLAARKEVKTALKSIDKNTSEYMIADQLQNAFKISANSMYGSLASRMGPLIFPFGGMCVTAIGRRSLLKVKSTIQEQYKATVVYGDTDSAYVLFKGIPLTDLEAFCLRVSDEVSRLFPKPMKLEYEGKIYKVLFLLTKKRYAFNTLGKDNLEYKGILLKRRDSSMIIRSLYKKILCLMMDGAPKHLVEKEFIECLSIIASGCLSAAEYAITSSLKNIDDFEIKPKSVLKVYYGAYTVSRLMDDPKKRAAQLKRKKLTDETEYYRFCLPGHVQLALRMRERGQSIQSGARLAMVFTKRGGVGAQGYEKLEELEYFETFLDKKWIDTSHYVKLFLTPVQELFTAYFGKDVSLYFKGLNETVGKRARLVEELNYIFCPLVFGHNK